MYVIALLALLNLLQSITSTLDGFGEYEWFLWDATHVLSIIVLAWLYFSRVSYDSLSEKLISFIFLLVAVWGGISFLAASFTDRHAIVSGISFIGFLPFLTWILLGGCCYKIASDKYNSNDTFFVYKRPTSTLGLFALAFGLKGQGVSLVTEGREFLFIGEEDGKLRVHEIKHVRQSNRLYRKSGVKISAEQARKICGTEWKFWRTCFHVFRPGKF